MDNLKSQTILVVDDLESIRDAVAEHLSARYRVAMARDGIEALDILAERKIDLVITDIRMPRMDGLELIREIQEKYPSTQYALMTAYNTDDYLRFVREQKIWNLIPKTTLLDLRFVGIMADKLLSQDIFGVARYFPNTPIHKTDLNTLRALAARGNWNTEELFAFAIASEEDYEHVSETVGRLLMQRGAPSMTLQVVEELVSNALVRSPKQLRNELGERVGARELLRAALSIPGNPPYEMCCGVADGQAVVSVVDPHGTLQRDEILLRLERYTKVGEDGLPLGVLDSHGRGLFISREHLDHLVFNIHPKKRTEVIGIVSLELDQRYRAVSIYHRGEDPDAVS